MIEITIPMELPNPSNKREHWAVRAERAKSQRSRVRRRMPDVHETISPVAVVRLTRIGKRRLDDDGVVASLKAVRDQVATWLRIDDASPLVRWEYAQERGEPSVRIRVDVVGGESHDLLEDRLPVPPARVRAAISVRTLQPTPNVVRGSR